MRILAIETSCDETAAAIVDFSTKNQPGIILSTQVATSLALHAKTGGIIPEIAARNQIQYIIPVIDKTLKDASMKGTDIDAIAVTYGPGLIGSLLIGVETAKTLSYVFDKPLIPVNHLFGHIYANFIGENSKLPEFPAIALIISGGHTDLVLMKSHTDIDWLGGTRDDASGEALDKIGRMLGISYPAGPEIEQLAKKGNPKAFRFPRPIMHDGNYDFSFSGLKTAVLRELEKRGVTRAWGRTEGSLPASEAKTGQNPHRVPAGSEDDRSHRMGDGKRQDPEILKQDIARCTQDAIFDVLLYKTMKAAKEFNVKSILLGGGVAANETLREQFAVISSQLGGKFFAPSTRFCTLNAAMIAAAAYYIGKETAWENITANPELYFD